MDASNSSDFSKLLVELASAVTITNPADLAELEHIHRLLNEVQRGIDESGRLAPEMICRVHAQIESAESNLSSLLTGKVADTAGALGLIAQQVDSLQKLVDEGIKTEPHPGEKKTAATGISADDAPLVRDFITESNEHVESAEAALLRLESAPGDAESINQVFRAFHTIKGMAGFLNLTEIGSLAHAAESLLDLARKNIKPLNGPRLEAVFSSLDMLKKMLCRLKDALETGSAIPPQENLAALVESLGALIEDKAGPEAAPQKQAAGPVVPETQQVAENPAPAAGKTVASSGDDKIKVSTARLDNLVNMVGELVIAQLMVAQQAHGIVAPEHDLARKIGHQGKIIRELQELSMSLRMIPISGLFQKMARLVRDLSHKAGKAINFETIGEETEIDRNIVDMLADPLVHMIRNSVDHGIEPRDERLGAGKSGAGLITLKAYHQGGNIVVEVADDGKGLDKEKILKKAMDNRIIASGAELSEQEIFKLIFHAGLSTAEKVTDISGRGVGMDVVRKNIEALRGKIEIASVPGRGTTFTIRLPLTLAIIDGQIVRIADRKFIIPIMSIEHSIRPAPEQSSTLQGRAEMVSVRGRLLPLIRLYKVFGIPNACTEVTAASVVIVESESRKCCIMVDELLGQQQVVIKSLGEGIGTVRGVSGSAILGDGTISLILDAPGLIEFVNGK